MLELVLRNLQSIWGQTTGSGVDWLSRSLNAVDDRVENGPVVVRRSDESRILRQQIEGIRKCSNHNRNVLSRSGREEGVNRETCDCVDKTAASEIDLQRELTQEVGAQDGV